TAFRPPSKSGVLLTSDAGSPYRPQIRPNCSPHPIFRPESRSTHDVEAAIDIDGLARAQARAVARQGRDGDPDRVDRDARARRHPARGMAGYVDELADSDRGSRLQRAGRDDMNANAFLAQFTSKIAAGRLERRLDGAHEVVVLDDLVGAVIAHREKRPAF